jgi:hypothetical protein
MAQELLKPGFYAGRIMDYGVKKTEKGDPAPTIAFEVLDAQGNRYKVFWQGSWNGRAMDLTMEALMVCGLRQASKLMHLAEGKESGLLDMSSSYDLDISIEISNTDPSKKWNRVNWINASGASKFKNAITVQEFAPLLNERNLAAEFARVAKEKGYESQSFSRAVQPAVDQIPF